MDDSILYYVVIGVIYLLSKLFGKKKNQEIPSEVDEYEEIEKPARPKKAAPTFEDILKELAGDNIPDFSEKEKTKPLEHTKPEPVLATDLVDYQKQNIEEVKPDEMIDIVPHKPIERKRPEFLRDDHFDVEEEDSEMAADLGEMLADYDGIRRAIVIKEVLDRKY
ncbi:MAG: hypothetical protein ABJF11_13855 [Reichenbachiella sp.]|uniref:hypothetical protein n=1 Tax=Reichenbachiella sp. TaxID=2184521 RepID=UPI003264AF5A